jgi:hypothetical protein
MRYIVIIWHQAGGRNENEAYYVWNDENEEARVFYSKTAAQQSWKESGMSKIHAGTIVCVSAEKRTWI